MAANNNNHPPESRVKVGIIGCGNISQTYVKGCRAFPILELAACADIDLSRAQALAKEHKIPKACTVEQLLADPDIQIDINLTVPNVHADVSLAAIAAGKHVHSEKPLATTRDDAEKIITAAKARGVRVGSAPDTFMGAGIQTCRKLIDDGAIGVPLAAMATMMSHGPEGWHPNPDFFYKVGGGPLFDMGPYYLTALISLLGAAQRTTASVRISMAQRTITNAARFGEKIEVETPTHIAGVIDFENGAVATLITSFDTWLDYAPRLEIYGSEGTLSVPDPNTFGGPVRLLKPGKSWQEMPLTHSYAENYRGIAVADMAVALESGRAHRANGEMAFHVVDIMQSLGESSAAGRHIDLGSTCERPAPLPTGLKIGELDR